MSMLLDELRGGARALRSLLYEVNPMQPTG